MNFLKPHFLMICCVLCSAAQTLCAQTDQTTIEHDTIKARRYFERGNLFASNTEQDSSILFFDRAITIYEGHEQWERVLEVYWSSNRVHMINRTLKKSLELLNRAISLGKMKLPHKEYLLVKFYLSRGFKYIQLGHFESAREDLEKGFDLYEKYNLSEEYLQDYYYNRGALHLAKDEFDEAQNFYCNSLELLIRLSASPRDIANSYNAIGSIYYFKADFRLAEYYWRKGATLIRDDVSLSSRSLYYLITKNLGAIAFQKGNYSNALENYSVAFDWESSQVQDTQFLADSYFNIAEVFGKQDKLSESITYFEKALDIYGKTIGYYHPDVIEVLEKIGTTYLRENDVEKAESSFRRALGISKSIQNNFDIIAFLYQRLGSVFQLKNEQDSAGKYYTEALTISKEINGDVHPSIAECYLSLAAFYKVTKKWNIVLGSCEDAISAVTKREDKFEELSTKSILFPTKGIDVLSTYAQYLTDAYLENYGEIDNLKKALSYIELAIELIQQKRVLVFDQKAQRDFSKRYAPVYEEGLRIALLLNKETGEEKYLDTAFQMMEGSKAFTLNQSIQDREEPIAYTLPDSLLEKERSLKVDISFYQEEILNRKTNLDGYDTVLVMNYEDKLFYRKRDFELLKQQLEEAFPKYHELKYQNTTLSLTEVQQKLTEHELLIEYLWHEESVTIMGISKTEVVYEEVPIDQDLLDQIAAINVAFNEPQSTLSVDEYTELSNDIYRKLLVPALVNTTSKPSKLIIIPDGPLTQLNFDLLVRKDSAVDQEWKDLSYMIKDYPIATGYSASLFFDDPAQTQSIANDLLAFSFGEEDEIVNGAHLTLTKVRSSDPTMLPGSAKEVKTIADLVEGDYYYGRQANEQTFKEVAPRYQILHLALHGTVDEENPDFSKLHLHSSDTTEDGQLHVYELYNMELNADLAVLSACNTGSGKYQTGEGVMSLGHAFSYAGVNSLLLTRWDLSDEAAPEIMKVFYRELKAGKSKSEALRTAKLEYLENASLFRSNPFYWGSFFVLGDDSPVDFRSNNQWIYVVFGGLFLLIFVLALMRRRASV